MAQAQGSFSVMNNVESEVFGFDFVNDLPEGDSIVSVNAVTLTVYEGTDSNPSSRLNGGPNIVGTQVLQRITGPLTAVVYQLMIVVNTAQGNIIDLWSYLNCVPP